MKFYNLNNRLIVFALTLLMAGCEESNQTPAKVTVTTAPAPEVKTTKPIATPPEWIVKAKKDAAANCYLDVVNGSPLIVANMPVNGQKGSPLLFAGWAFDKKTLGVQLEAAFELATKDRKQVYIIMGDRGEREDVSNNINYHQLGLKLAGISVAADTTGIAPGIYELSFIMQRNAKEGVICVPNTLWQIKF